MKIRISKDTFLKAMERNIKDKRAGRRNKTVLVFPPDSGEAKISRIEQRKKSQESIDPQRILASSAPNRIQGDYVSSFSELLSETSLSIDEFDEEPSDEEKREMVEENNEALLKSLFRAAKDADQVEKGRKTIEISWEE